ncbi:P-loop containing nucleoside triphosphate hydrolase protein [Mycena olivaceomarginata]|nr:P-loop containing nucleoside triphosphate hydrolase protein [Mycena olivaceomarginata]
MNSRKSSFGWKIRGEEWIKLKIRKIFDRIDCNTESDWRETEFENFDALMVVDLRVALLSGRLCIGASHDFRSLATNGGMRQFNVAILGARGVGKSALTDRFVTVRDVFVDKYDPTIGEQYHRSMVVDGEQDSLKFFVTTGVEQFTAFTEVYIKSCLGFVLVFSLTQEGSLKEVESLRKQIFRIKGSENVPIVVVGTKSDVMRVRYYPDAAKKAKKMLPEGPCIIM